jgi:hypothetical protein
MKFEKSVEIARKKCVYDTNYNFGNFSLYVHRRCHRGTLPLSRIGFDMTSDNSVYFIILSIWLSIRLKYSRCVSNARLRCFGIVF